MKDEIKKESDLDKYQRRRAWAIGDKVRDDDGNIGVVCIRWNDGDICDIENDAAHPGPALI